MSNNYSAGLDLFAGCDNLFQDFTPAQESTIAGGRRGRGRSSNTSGRSSNTSGRTRTRTGR